MDVVARWQAEPDRSVTAQLGVRMLAGEWTTAADAAELGGSTALMGTVVKALKNAGYTVDVASAGGNAKRYRVKPTRGRAKRVGVEHAGTSHPQLGAVLTVRALALDEAGQLVVQLSNGNGSGWLAQITGHVEP